MAVRKSIPKAPVLHRPGAISFHREYLIRLGLVRPAPASPGQAATAKPAKLARLLQGGAP